MKEYNSQYYHGFRRSSTPLEAESAPVFKNISDNRGRENLWGPTGLDEVVLLGVPPNSNRPIPMAVDEG
ncbi:MAG: hypothetical protein EA414_05010 [Arthrospira sp. PLM2.Bin9]|nr:MULTISPECIES: hypothetical protein [unclassified Arthrospira]MBS0016977.1 hypothetical protein [Arthrospira sp. SH-MAG29]TVU54821.1 MAG: hypothetical protein EA414_05010 [Arthrospira sp. PLM2.Bin9]